MKKLLLSLIMFSGCIIVSAQESVAIDFKARKTTLPTKDPNPGDFYNVVISNINPNRYKIVINSKDTIISSPLQMPTFASIDLTNITGLAASAAPIPATAKVNVETIGSNKKVTITTQNASDNPVVRELNLHAANAKTRKDELVKLVDEFESLKLEVYKQHVDQLSLTPSTEPYDGVAGIGKFLELRKKISKLRGDIETEKNGYATFFEDETTKKFLELNPTYSTKIANLSKTFEELLSKTDTVLEAINADKVLEIIRSVLYLDGKSKQFTSLPLQFTKEQARVTIKFIPRDTTIGVQEEQMTFIFPVHANEYWGVGTSFYYSNLRQSRYYLQATTVGETTTYKAIEEDELDRELGIAVMLRGGTKLYKDWLGGHIGIGPGLSIGEDVKPRLLFGAGVSVGRKHAFTLDFGGIAGYVAKRAGGTDTTTVYTDKPDRLTSQKLRVGNYFAIGYIYKL